MLAGCLGLPAPASAWPRIEVTASELLSVDPLRVRTTFELSFTGPGPTYYAFVLQPLGPEGDPATAALLECQAAPAWECDAAGAPGALLFYTNAPPSLPPVNAFSIVTDRPTPCVRFTFIDVLLARVPAPATLANEVVEACLDAAGPVAALPRTWGALKATYR